VRGGGGQRETVGAWQGGRRPGALFKRPPAPGALRPVGALAPLDAARPLTGAPLSYQVKPCPKDYYCPGGVYPQPAKPCPSGTTTGGVVGASDASQCIPKDPCRAPGTCCQGSAPLPGWSPGAPACPQSAVPPPACVLLGSDEDNCGACGNVCPHLSTCKKGVCVVQPGAHVPGTNTSQVGDA
jgi:hypothetical protein